MPFKPGRSGNPSGKRKEFEGIGELARRFGPSMVAILARIAKDPKAAVAARVSAAGMLLDRGFGRAPSFSTTDVGEFRRATELSDDDLIRIALPAGIKIEPAVKAEVSRERGERSEAIESDSRRENIN